MIENHLNSSIITTDNIINEKEKEDDKDEEEKYILIFDFGGGTYDVSYIEKNGNNFETIASAGDQNLGGGDLDNKLMEYCLDEFSKNLNIDKKRIKENYKYIQRLKIACEQTKKILSIKDEDNIYIEDFYEEESLSKRITRAKFEELCKEYFDKLIPPLDRVIEDAKIKGVNKIDEIILVGGSSKIPKIKEILANKFPNIPINDKINPDEVVAYGATLFCEKLKGNNNELLEKFNYFDSTQHSYGIEVENGEMEIILKRGINYPANVTRYFHNYFDDQITFDIKIYEGENKYCKDNHFLGKFTLENLPKMKSGELICTVNFRIDINQMMKVTASIGNDNKKGISITRDKENKSKVNLLNIEQLSINSTDKEKKMKTSIIEYSKSYNKLNNDDEKYTLLKNYNDTIISYLSFLLETIGDFESEKFFFFVELLFESYAKLYSKSINKKLSDDYNKKIKENVVKFLKIISLKNPFRLKQLIMIFEGIKIEISDILYFSSIICIKLLFEKGKLYYGLNGNNIEKRDKLSCKCNQIFS